jgi:protein-S-isoprenylcysteine O-methyltransferase Ste14
LFLLGILGVIPSIFYVCGEWASGSRGFWLIAGRFWAGFRVLVGAALFAIGLAAYSYCSAWLIFFGKGPHVEFDPPKVFVASGPYRWVRNPVVITLLVTVLGEAIWFGSISILVLLAVGLPLAHYQVTRIEEPRLKARFGASYEEYCRRVNRWTPSFPRD